MHVQYMHTHMAWHGMAWRVCVCVCVSVCLFMNCVVGGLVVKAPCSWTQAVGSSTTNGRPLFWPNHSHSRWTSLLLYLLPSLPQVVVSGYNKMARCTWLLCVVWGSCVALTGLGFSWDRTETYLIIKILQKFNTLCHALTLYAHMCNQFVIRFVHVCLCACVCVCVCVCVHVCMHTHIIKACWLL